jgi:hypothetical protein
MDNLKSQIIKEFSKATPPNVEEIAVDDDWDKESIDNDFSDFLDKPVETSVLEEHAHALEALAPTAFVFFIKDYMIYTIENIHEIESTEYETMDCLIDQLVDLKTDDDFWIDRLKILTTGQKKIILDFLIHIKSKLPDTEDQLIELVEEAISKWSTLQ